MRTSSRSGMTILEVLFAIMITTVGLLGAVSVFPVASEYARKGRLNDEVAMMGESAAHKFDGMGMRRLDHWIAFVDQSATNQPAARFNGSQIPASPVFWKTAYCIDPRFTAQNVTAHGNNEQNWTYFPAYPSANRMQRLTLTASVQLINGQIYPSNPAGPPMGLFHADHVFTFQDRLAYERPGVQKGELMRNDNASPAYQLLSPITDPNNPGNPPLPGKREDDGQLSWMATLVPEVDRLTATRPDKYVLSIVVFDRRSPNLITRDFNLAAPAPVGGKWVDNEWTVSIDSGDFYSNGYGGGEVRLNADYEEKLKIHTGDWLLLAGMRNGPKDSNGQFIAPFPAPDFKWYRVSDGDDVDTAMIGGVQRFVKNVTLIGPDWELADINLDGNPDAVEVVVMPGVVSVMERTVRLEVDGN